MINKEEEHKTHEKLKSPPRRPKGTLVCVGHGDTLKKVFWTPFLAHLPFPIPCLEGACTPVRCMCILVILSVYIYICIFTRVVAPSGPLGAPCSGQGAMPESRWHSRVTWLLSSHFLLSPLCPSWLCTGQWKSRPRWTGHLLLHHNPPDCRRSLLRSRPGMFGCLAMACCLRHCCWEKEKKS